MKWYFTKQEINAGHRRWGDEVDNSLKIKKHKYAPICIFALFIYL